MTADEFEIVLRFVAGHWPTPEMGDDETIAWRRTLLPLGFDDACNVIDLIAATGRRWRPTDGEFLAEYRSYARHKATPVAPPTPERVSRSETAAHWLAVMRQQLSESGKP